MKPSPSTERSGTYPPPPWRLSGRMWSGLFLASAHTEVPDQLRMLLSPRWIGIGLFRYRGAVAAYDELLVGLPVRCGLRPGLWIQHIWVNHPDALQAGWEIWGLPKRMADFDWTATGVRIADDEGIVASLRLDARGSRLPWAWLPIPILGRRRCSWLYTRAHWRGRLGTPSFAVEQWSPRFAYRVEGKPRLGFGSDRYRLVVPAPRDLARAS